MKQFDMIWDGTNNHSNFRIYEDIFGMNANDTHASDDELDKVHWLGMLQARHGYFWQQYNCQIKDDSSLWRLPDDYHSLTCFIYAIFLASSLDIPADINTVNALYNT